MILPSLYSPSESNVCFALAGDFTCDFHAKAALRIDDGGFQSVKVKTILASVNLTPKSINPFDSPV